MAKDRLKSMGFNPKLTNQGNIYSLAKLKYNSLNALLNFSILAYLTNKEEKYFMNKYEKDKWKLMFICSTFGSRSICQKV